METSKKIRVCNAYCGVGGNRKNWTDVDVTAIELDENIAAIYQDFFPNDKVIVGDAHEYLLKHFNEFDFVWSSPPCPTHSRTNYFLKARNIIRYPDMKLWQEIILLQTHFQGRYCVENVISYYGAMLNPQEVARHYFWTNFFIVPFYSTYKIGKMNGKNQRGGMDANVSKLEINLDKYELRNKRLLLRNCVEPALGKHIFDCAFNGKAQTLFESQEMIQDNLFAEV